LVLVGLRYTEYPLYLLHILWKNELSVLSFGVLCSR